MYAVFTSVADLCATNDLDLIRQSKDWDGGLHEVASLSTFDMSVYYTLAATFRDLLTATHVTVDDKAIAVVPGFLALPYLKTVRKNLAEGRPHDTWALESFDRIISLSSTYSTTISVAVVIPKD